MNLGILLSVLALVFAIPAGIAANLLTPKVLEYIQRYKAASPPVTKSKNQAKRPIVLDSQLPTLAYAIAILISLSIAVFLVLTEVRLGIWLVHYETLTTGWIMVLLPMLVLAVGLSFVGMILVQIIKPIFRKLHAQG